MRERERERALPRGNTCPPLLHPSLSPYLSTRRRFYEVRANHWLKCVNFAFHKSRSGGLKRSPASAVKGLMILLLILGKSHG